MSTLNRGSKRRDSLHNRPGAARWCMVLCAALLCGLVGTATFSRQGHSAEVVTPRVINLTSKNVKSVLVDNNTVPVLIETCVTAACGLENDELNEAVQFFGGKIKVLRLDTTKEPKLYQSMLAAIALASGHPDLPAAIGRTSGRWAMHTLYGPHMRPIASTFGLITSEVIIGFVVVKLTPDPEQAPPPQQDERPKVDTM
jgi:hypothetical protein